MSLNSFAKSGEAGEDFVCSVRQDKSLGVLILEIDIFADSFFQMYNSAIVHAKCQFL